MNTSKLTEKIKATDLFIFDLDGTLVDSKKDLVLAVQHAAVAIGLPKKPEHEIEALLAAGSMSLIRDVLGSEDKFDEAFGHFTSYYAKHMLDHTRPYEGVIDVLDALEHKTLTVMSNKREKFCLETLRGLGMESYFSMVVGGDTRPHKKPHPDPLLYIADCLKMDPSRAMMIGDSPQDVEAAKMAGMYCVGIVNGFTSPERMRSTNADIYLETVGEFRDHFVGNLNRQT